MGYGWSQFTIITKSIMNKNKSEVILILDRSGSMASIKTDIEGGLKAFIDGQKAQPGECYVSLYQFDTVYEPVFENVNINKTPDIKIEPRGGTALLDAIGRTINAVGIRLAATKEEDRPGLVLICVLTDGQENSSREFTTAQVKELVTHQTDKYDWDFVFIGTNQDAVLTGASYGFMASKSLSFASNAAGISNSLLSCSGYATNMRGLSATGSAGSLKLAGFSDKERKEAMASP